MEFGSNMPADETTSPLDDLVNHCLTIDCTAPLSFSLVTQLNQFCASAEGSGAPLVCLIRLEGADEATVDPWPAHVEIHLVNKWEVALRRLERLDAVTVASIEGNCAGPAFDVLLAADYRIAAADARLRPPLHTGEVWPGMALYRLANQFGVAAARRLLLFAEEMTAADAERFGLIDETGDPVDILEARVPTLRARVGSELAIRRRLLLDATTVSFEDALGSHLAACSRALTRWSGTSSALFSPSAGEPAVAG
ncbi:enoyl-CoA-hydratase DpgB [Nocardia sp. CA-129566]|uniref:enoyl-CoA-hydratase DpgB n=1 Tax=Nocardia sp. CA-129566 TaxID=3239976 RepID=UPI003D9510CC